VVSFFLGALAFLPLFQWPLALFLVSPVRTFMPGSLSPSSERDNFLVELRQSFVLLSPSVIFFGSPLLGASPFTVIFFFFFSFARLFCYASRLLIFSLLDLCPDSDNVSPLPSTFPPPFVICAPRPLGFSGCVPHPPPPLRLCNMWCV